MNLQELVDELRDNILYDRSDSVSGDPDQLWSDATLVRYINESQRRFATRGLVIRDGTTAEVTQVTLEDGVSEYALHPSVIAVISAKVSTDAMDLVRTGHAVLNAYRTPDNNDWDLTRLYTLPPGAPRAYSTDERFEEDDSGSMSVVTLRVYPEPDADADGTQINLRVIRKPLDDLSVNNMGATPEIPSDHHLEMLDWAAYLALRIVDTDAGNPKRAAEFAQSFEAHVQAARNMVLKKMFVPQGWGFGRGGWGWGASHG
jgi:hypothetical protein